MTNIIFTFVIPTYNAAKTIKHTLESIREQKFNQDAIEILVVDGGSTDDTVIIACQYGAQILSNPHRLPEFAKQIGMQNARGRYVVRMDADEAFVSDKQLQYRYDALQKYPHVHALITNNLRYVPGYGIAGNYLNIYGDPFTFFIYKPCQDILSTYHDNILIQNQNAYVLHFNGVKRPIGDGGTTTIDLEYAKHLSVDAIDDVTAGCSIFDKIMDTDELCLCIYGDEVYHRSQSSLCVFLRKLRFRVVNNIMHPSQSGFSSRKISQGNTKKYLFPLYAASIILPVVDGIKLSVRHKDLSMMLHIIYTEYVCACMVYYTLLNTFGIKKTNTRY